MSFQIMTPAGKISRSQGRLHQLPKRDPTDRFDLPDHRTWQMNLAVDHHDIDASMAKGILGETLVPTLDDRGQPIMTGIDSIRGSQEDCECRYGLGRIPEAEPIDITRGEIYMYIRVQSNPVFRWNGFKSSGSSSTFGSPSSTRARLFGRQESTDKQ